MHSLMVKELYYKLSIQVTCVAIFVNPSSKHHIPDIIRVDVWILSKCLTSITLLVCVSEGLDSQCGLQILHSYLFISIKGELGFFLGHQEAIV